MYQRDGNGRWQRAAVVRFADGLGSKWLRPSEGEGHNQVQTSFIIPRAGPQSQSKGPTQGAALGERSLDNRGGVGTD